MGLGQSYQSTALDVSAFLLDELTNSTTTASTAKYPIIIRFECIIGEPEEGEPPRALPEPAAATPAAAVVAKGDTRRIAEGAGYSNKT